MNTQHHNKLALWHSDSKEHTLSLVVTAEIEIAIERSRAIGQRNELTLVQIELDSMQSLFGGNR